MADRDHSDFYVYVLFRENGVPFYVGKGRGKRWHCHEGEARRGGRSHKCAIIRKILATGRRETIKVKIHEGITEAVAHEYEMALIKAIGRGKHGSLTNLTDGGEGLTGMVGQKRSPESRAKMSAARRANKAMMEHIKHLSDNLRGTKRTPEQIEKVVAKIRGRKQSPEHIAKRIAPHVGAKRSADARANMGASHRGKPLSEAHREKLRLIGIGRKMTPESIAKTIAAHLGKKRSAETRARISASKLGKPIASRGRKWSPEHLAKRSATRRANNARRRSINGQLDLGL